MNEAVTKALAIIDARPGEFTLEDLADQACRA